MSDELNRRTGASFPLWFGCFYFSMICFAFAISEYIYVTDYAAAGGQHPPVSDRQQARTLRRSAFGKVAEWGYPRIGVWGCVAIFAVPGAALLGTAIYLRRRREL